MFYNLAKPELIYEQYYVTGEIIEKGNLVDLDKRTYLMVEASPMAHDFIEGISLKINQNKLSTQLHERKMSASHLYQAMIKAEQPNRLAARSADEQFLSFCLFNFDTLSQLN